MVEIFDDEEQFKELREQLVRHARKLLRRFPAVARECDAEDLVSEAVVKLHQHTENGGDAVLNPGGWLYRAMFNYVQDKCDKLKRERHLPSGYEPAPVHPEVNRRDVMVDLGLVWRRQADQAHSTWPTGKKIDYFAVLLVLLRQNTCIHLGPHIVAIGGADYEATLLDNVAALYPWHPSERESAFKAGFADLEKTWSVLFERFLAAPTEYSPQVVAEALDGMSVETHLPASTWYQWCKRARDYLEQAFAALELPPGGASPLWENARLRNESARQ